MWYAEIFALIQQIQHIQKNKLKWYKLQVQEICAIEIDAPKKQHEHHTRDEEMCLATENKHDVVKRQDEHVRNSPLHHQTENKAGIITTTPADENQNSGHRAELEKVKNRERETSMREELRPPREDCQAVAVDQATELKLLQIKENEIIKKDQQSIVEPGQVEVKELVPQEKLQQPDGKLVQLESGKTTVTTAEINSTRELNTTEVGQHAAVTCKSQCQAEQKERTSPSLCPRPADLQPEPENNHDDPPDYHLLFTGPVWQMYMQLYPYHVQIYLGLGTCDAGWTTMMTPESAIRHDK